MTAPIKQASACLGSESRFTRPTRREMLRAVWSRARDVPVGHSAWREQVKHRLLDGYGSEDIAIWLDCHPDRVRAEIARLRRAGMLAKWWGLG